MDQDEPLSSWVAFKGFLSRGDISVPIRLRLRIGPDGELQFRHTPLRMTRAAIKLGDLQASEGRLTIDAISALGTHFRCETLVLTSRQGFSGLTRSTLRLGFRYSQAQFSRNLPEGRLTPVLRIDLRGFEAFPAVEASCPLGDIVMQGKYPAPKDELVSGVMWVTATVPPPDLQAWRRDVKALTEHVLNLMSFALSHQVRYPLQSIWFDETWELVATNQSYAVRNAQHVLHPMHGLQGFLEAAVASFFAPPIVAQNLRYALEWFAMAATHSEMRLTKVMTALENLIDSNLAEAEKVYLAPKAFKRAGSDLRQAISGALAAEAAMAGAKGAQALEQLGAALPWKVQDLNRRPLIDKLLLLAERWDVPLQGLPRDEIAKAITARNLIVHRGYYYEPDLGSREQVDLWDHLLTMREVMMRFVFTIIAYEGQYLVFRKGQQEAIFPPLMATPARSDSPRVG